MKKALFPGYVFVSTEYADEVLDRLQIIVSGVSPVCIGGGFNPIRQDEQDFLASMMNAWHEIEYSGGNIIDGKLIVDYGPLKDKTQFVRRIDRHHRTAGVAVSLWGMEQCVKVGLEVKQKS